MFLLPNALEFVIMYDNAPKVHYIIVPIATELNTTEEFTNE